MYEVPRRISLGQGGSDGDKVSLDVALDFRSMIELVFGMQRFFDLLDGESVPYLNPCRATADQSK